MTWLTLDEAVDAVMQKKRFGAHVFYYPDNDRFMVLRDSVGGQYAQDRIYRHLKYYQGFIKDQRRRQDNFKVEWSLSNVVHELVSILEREAHNFTIHTASIIYQNVTPEPVDVDPCDTEPETHNHLRSRSDD